MSYDLDRYQRRSIRLRGYEYSQPGAHFVTICTHGQEFVLGDVVDGQVHLSAWGEVVRRVWQGLPVRFERIELDAFVVMPNHIHGIIVIRALDDVVGAIHAWSRRSGKALPLQECRLSRCTWGR